MIKIRLHRPSKTANIRTHCYTFSLVLLLLNVSPVKAANLCNPDVLLADSDNMLSQTLTRLAEEYEFKLTFPMSLDRPVKVRKSMKLNKLIKTLTVDMNTVLKTKTIEGCAVPVLTQIIVLPVGKENEFVSVEQPEPNVGEEYIYIENMEQYATNVLNGKQNAEPGRMTPEQREEFNYVMEILKAQQESD